MRTALSKAQKHNESVELGAMRRELMQVRAKYDALRMRRQVDPEVVRSELVMELWRRARVMAEARAAMEEYQRNDPVQTPLKYKEHWNRSQAAYRAFMAVVEEVVALESSNNNRLRGIP